MFPWAHKVYLQRKSQLLDPLGPRKDGEEQRRRLHNLIGLTDQMFYIECAPSRSLHTEDISKFYRTYGVK